MLDLWNDVLVHELRKIEGLKVGENFDNLIYNQFSGLNSAALEMDCNPTLENTMKFTKKLEEFRKECDRMKGENNEL